MEMVAHYLELLKACMRGKKFAKFAQQWFEHIHEYMAEKGDQADMWRTVVCRSKLDVSEQEQRIVVSTIAYHIHDPMAEKVKKYKEDLLAMDGPATTYDTEALHCTACLPRDRGEDVKTVNLIYLRLSL